MAGVSKKNSSAGRTVLPAIPRARCSLMRCALSDARCLVMFVLENVKNLKSHDQGKNVPHHHADAGRTGL
ncbi:hypothetical protein ACLB1O_06580 [Escherichia coli]